VVVLDSVEAFLESVLLVDEMGVVGEPPCDASQASEERTKNSTPYKTTSLNALPESLSYILNLNYLTYNLY
jgi:hypothetical protein